MKRLHIIGSTIDLDNTLPLKGGYSRSFFSKEERARQTYNTIYSILTLYPQDTICLLDSSLSNIEPLLVESSVIQTKVQRFYVKDYAPQIAEIVLSTPNKSYGESILLKSFIQQYYKDIIQFDYIIKHTGRYFIDESFDLSILNEENKNSLFFKQDIINSNPTKEPWGAPEHKTPDQNPWDIHRTPTVLYAWGSSMTNYILKMYEHVIDHTINSYCDGELLLPLFFHQEQLPIHRTQWKVNGWGGQDGKFYIY